MSNIFIGQLLYVTSVNGINACLLLRQSQYNRMEQQLFHVEASTNDWLLLPSYRLHRLCARQCAREARLKNCQCTYLAIESLSKVKSFLQVKGLQSNLNQVPDIWIELLPHVHATTMQAKLLLERCYNCGGSSWLDATMKLNHIIENVIAMITLDLHQWTSAMTPLPESIVKGSSRPKNRLLTWGRLALLQVMMQRMNLFCYSFW